MNGNDLDVTKEKLGVFSGNWNTAGAEVSKRGTRFPLIFLVNFAPEGQMRVEFQSKVYSKVRGVLWMEGRGLR